MKSRVKKNLRNSIKFALVVSLFFEVSDFCYSQALVTPTSDSTGGAMTTVRTRLTNDQTGEGEDVGEDGGAVADQEEILKNGKHDGVPLTKATAKPEPEPPTNLKIKVDPVGRVAHISWDADPRATGYFVFVSEDGKDFIRQMFPGIKKHEYPFYFPKKNKTYYIGIECIGPYGKSTKMTVQSFAVNVKN